MNPILHQTKWDFRLIRTSWIIWVALLIGTTVLRHIGLTRPFMDAPVLQISLLVEVVVIHLLGGLLVAFTVLATPFSGSTAFWKTRPLTRRALFWQKTLSILVLIGLPAIASRCVQYLLIDPDPSILTVVALTDAPLTLGLYLLAAVWAAICSNLRTLTVCLAGTVGFAMLSGIITGFVHLLSQPLIVFGSPSAPSWALHTLTTAFILMMILFFFAWCYSAALNRRAAAVVITGFAILIVVSQGSIWVVGLEGNTPWIDKELQLEVIDQDDPPDPSIAILYPQLGVQLPQDQFLMINHLEARFIRAGDRRPSFEGHPMSGRVTARQLARLYPAGTRCIEGGRHPSHVRPFLNDNLGSTPGTFSGEYSGRLFQWRKIGTMPAIHGSHRTFPGHGRVRLSHFHSTGLNFRITTVGGTGASRLGVSMDRGTLFTVLRHTKSDTIIVPAPGSTRGGGGFKLVARSQELSVGEEPLRAALGGPPGLDALSEFELDLYYLTPIGAVAGEFKKDNWIPFMDSSPEVDDGTSTPPDAWTKAVLPDNPTDAQVDDYLDTIIHGIPRELHHTDQETLQARFHALGSAHLDHLIARFPVPHYFRHYAMHTIRKHATREHLPALLAAFADDPRLAILFIQKRWQADAVSIARAHLRHRGPFYSGTATHLVAIATVDPDPSINDELFHHFVLSGGGHSIMIKHLRKQPGFPLDDAIARAWNRERSGLTHDTRDLAYHAIRLGDPEALRQAIAHFTGLTNPDDRNYDDERTLLEAGIEQPEGTEPAPWAHTHFAQLHFDPLRKVFHLPE